MLSPHLTEEEARRPGRLINPKPAALKTVYDQLGIPFDGIVPDRTSEGQKRSFIANTAKRTRDQFRGDRRRVYAVVLETPRS